MRTCAFVWTTVLLALAAGVGALRGHPGKEAKSDPIADLIAQLGDKQFARREAASKALARIGEPALAALWKAADSHDVAEVRASDRRLVDAIEDGLPFVFNGKNLTGWRGLADCWTVKDGALVGTTPARGLAYNTFLCSKREHTDFELKFQVRVSGVGWGGNSGVQIRSQIVDGDRFTVKGPQGDIGENYWGDLHGELTCGLMKKAPQAVVARALKENDFNDYYIKCVGQHVTIKLNGETTVDDDVADLPASGIIAWQLHGRQPMSVTFKNIEFKDLSRN